MIKAWNLSLMEDVIGVDLFNASCRKVIVIMKVWFWNITITLLLKNASKCTPSDVIHGKSASFQVMAWCHEATSHYLKQCSLIIHWILWNSPESNFTRNANEHLWHAFRNYALTYLPLDKMVAVSQTIFSDVFFVNEKFSFFIRISLKIVPNGSIVNNPGLV